MTHPETFIIVFLEKPFFPLYQGKERKNVKTNCLTSLLPKKKTKTQKKKKKKILKEIERGGKEEEAI